jgi:type VI protein secretion system component Hcp
MTSRINRHWRWLVALGAVFVPAAVMGAGTLPFTFSSGTPIRAAEVNANFDALQTKLDALSGQGSVAAPVIGTLTLSGLSPISIRSFAETVSDPISFAGGGSGTGKPSFSDIEVVKDLDSTSPVLNLRLNQGFHFSGGDITVGDFSVRLSDVILTGISVAGAKSEHPLESVSLLFRSIEWTALGHTSTYDRARAIGGGANPGSLAFAFFGAAATPDASLLPILEYAHSMSLPCDPFSSTGCKVTHTPLSLLRRVDGATIDNLGLAVTGAHLSHLDLQWRTTGTEIDSRVQLSNVAVANVRISTRGDGSLVESVDYAYAQILWAVGSVTSGWDLAANKAL